MDRNSRNRFGWTSELVGFPSEVREIYEADDTFVQPSYWDLRFLNDNKYLLMDVYNGFPRFVTVSLETGEAINLEINGMAESERQSDFRGDSKHDMDKSAG